MTLVGVAAIGDPWRRMTKAQRALMVIALVGLVAVTLADGTGAATGAAARALGIAQGVLLTLASLTLGWRWYSDNRAQPPGTARPSASDAPVTGLATSILEAESGPNRRD